MIIPTVLEKHNNYERAYDLYSRLLNDRIIFVEGEITDSSANIIVGELLYLNSISKDDIYMYINSPGGSVTAGFAIYDTMNYIESDVSTICIGMAASMGAFLLAGGAKLGGCSGQATEIKIAAERIIKLKKKLNKLLSLNTGKSEKEIEKDTERDNFMSAEEALSYGLVDKII